MNDDFDGLGDVEPVIGPVRMVRTFEIGDDGALLAINGRPSTPAWVDGDNTAKCLFARHHAPAVGCTCGFYAYNDPRWLQYGEQNNVLAVVECHGRTIAGTRGIRTQRIRIVALWLGKRVPPEIAARVAARYPSARLFDRRRQMLATFSPTVLDGQRRPSRLLPWRVPVASWLAQIAVIAIAGVTVVAVDRPLSPSLVKVLLASVCLPGLLIVAVCAGAAQRRRARVPPTTAWAACRLAWVIPCAVVTLELLSVRAPQSTLSIEAVVAVGAAIELAAHFAVSARDKSGRWASFAPIQRLEKRERQEQRRRRQQPAPSQRSAPGPGEPRLGPAT